MKKLISIALLILFVVVSSEGIMAKEIAQVSKQSVTVNRKATAMKGYLINNSNYFKLRDFAMVITEARDDEFDVQWVESERSIVIVPEQRYTALGTELQPAAKIKTIQPNKAKIMLQGIPYYFDAYNINGYNYFKLRDLCALLGIGVKYDATKNEVQVDTDKDYYDTAYEELMTMPKVKYRKIESKKHGFSFEVPEVLASVPLFEDSGLMTLYADSDGREDEDDDDYTYLSVSVRKKLEGETLDTVVVEEGRKALKSWITERKKYPVKGAQKSYAISYKNSQNVFMTVLFAEKGDTVYIVRFYSSELAKMDSSLYQAISRVKQHVYDSLVIE